MRYTTSRIWLVVLSMVKTWNNRANKEYSEDEMVDCLIQIKQKYGNLYLTMFGCTCEVRKYADRIISIIREMR